MLGPTSLDYDGARAFLSAELRTVAIWEGEGEVS
jgi:hypothetical protein